MSIKSFYSLTGRCPKSLTKHLNYSHHPHLCFMLGKHEIPSRSLPISVIKRSFTVSHIYPNVASQEKVLKESKNILEVQSSLFKDESFNEPVSHETLVASLQKYDSITDQMDCLVETLSLTPEDIKKRTEFCRNIEQLLKPFFNNFNIEMFGSSVNGFGFKGCDIDLTFETSTKANDKSCYLERPDVPVVSEVLSGKVSVQELSELPLREQLVFIHTVFLELYKDSEIPAKFINAHVPLVRFFHDKYNLKCDLTIKNKVAHANTKLLFVFAKLDKRVSPLMMTLRYWAKHTELIGKGLMFNTYTISLLVIYFLQTRSPPILPSAEFIMSLTDELSTLNERNVVEFIKNIPPTKNNQTVEELLREFFFFYLYFDFTRVICPLTASAIPREEFFSKPENSRFRLNSICVQDPLCLNHNVAELVDFKHCRKFFTELITVCKIFQSSDSCNSENKLNLVTILDRPKEIALHEVEDDKVISFDISVSNKNTSQSDDKIAAAAQSVIHILQHILLFKCQTLELNQIINLLKEQDKLVAKRRKEWQERKNLFKLKFEDAIPHLKNRHRKKNVSENVEENHSCDNETLLEQFESLIINHKLILCCKCEVSKNTWLGRDMVDANSLPSDNILEQQKLVSDLVAQQNAANLEDQKMKSFTFLYESYFSPSNSDKMQVVFRPLQKMSFNPILGIFLKEYVTNILQEISN